MILNVTDGIDDESEPAAPSVLVARNKETTFINAGPSIAADDRHDLGHAWVLKGEDRRGDDMVRRMSLIEQPAIPSPAFTLGQFGWSFRPSIARSR